MKFSLSSLVTFSLLAAATNMAHASFPQPQSLVEDNVKDLDLLDGGEVLSLNDVNKRELKKHKSIKATKSKPSTSYTPPITPPIELIEGAYLYQGCQNNIFQATFLCGVFGDDDPDLCLYQEVKVGQINLEATSPDSVLTAGGSFFDPLLIATELTIDPDEFCVFSGTFRASAALKGNNILPIPMSTSNGCLQDKQNFEYTLKVEVKENGNLKLDFSDDGGFTYYTEDPNFTCPRQYIGNKIQDMEGLVALTAESATRDYEKNRILKDGRRLFFSISPSNLTRIIDASERIVWVATTACTYLCLLSF